MHDGLLTVVTMQQRTVLLLAAFVLQTPARPTPSVVQD